MTKQTMLGTASPNIPWEDRPANSSEVIWRYSRNPIIPAHLLPTSNSIFNSAVVPFKGTYAGVFRCDNTARDMRIHSGRSVDGLNWQIEPEPIRFVSPDPEIAPLEYCYDPRVVWIEDRYYVSWCNGYHGPTIGLGYTYDFRLFTSLRMLSCPTIAMECSSRARSTEISPCSAAPPIPVTRRLGMSSTVKARI